MVAWKHYKGVSDDGRNRTNVKVHIEWKKKNCLQIYFRPEVLSSFNRCGTIQDLIVTVLCNHEQPVMSTQNAASWGYFDVAKCSWNIDVLKTTNFPVHLLPSVVQPNTNFGILYDNIYDLPKGIIVGNCLKYYKNW